MQKWTIGGLAAMLFASMAAVAFTQPPNQAPATKAASQEEEFARQVVELTNKERARYKLTPLTMQKNLSAAAHWMARDLVQNPKFSHVDRQGRNIEARLPAFGYVHWHTIGENIAAGQTTPAKVVDSWMHSPGHRANILRPDFREIGIGYYNAPNTEYKCYWVQDFGSRWQGT
jgi:uncharacterized protein YkwD